MCSVSQVVSGSLRPQARQVPLSMEFFRQEYWIELPFPSPGNLPNPGIEAISPILQRDCLSLYHLGSIRTGHGTTDWFQIGKGVRQGCILSPCLFNLYAEYIIKNAGLEEA